MENDPLYRPWGNVSTTFWDRPTKDVDHRSVASAPPVKANQMPGPEPEPEHRRPDNAAPIHTAADAVPDMPEAYRDGILLVTSAFTSKDPQTLQRAVIEAERLNQAMTTEYGERDVRTISIREMSGWLEHLKGQHADATRWYLHTAGLLSTLLGNEDQRTRDSVRRGVATWLAITDLSEAEKLAPAILAIGVAIDGEESEAVQVVRQRMKALGWAQV
ncbi:MULTISPECIES: hypothetical protein [unclassified Streptomyces]|uniref:hypothetical protein n=1 Tax=unclassified Streptomyces TaxID=2593676 RepID=UPI0033A98E80